MRPYGRCGTCRQRFKITEHVSKCQRCLLVGERLKDRFATFRRCESDLDAYLEKWYGDSQGIDPCSSSTASSV
jgi:hypothetical protein